MHVSRAFTEPVRRTQAQRRALSRAALLEAAAQEISQYGYGNVVLDRVAKQAGYTRGALYHQFSGKEELALAVVDWVAQTWEREVWEPATRRDRPVEVLVELARGHIVYCRRRVARVMMALRVEFDGREDPVGRAVTAIGEDLGRRIGGLITAGRRDGSIPAGPSGRKLAMAIVAALEGLAIQIAGVRDDELIAERMVLGMLGFAAGHAG